jgi:ribosome silencing factor RsfS/YbeB/iojap
LQEQDLPTAPVIAARAAESKKALNIRVLDLRGISSFTDFFVICSGSNSRQIQTIADEIEAQLKEHGERPLGVEGYEKADWVLADYGDFIVNVFSPQAREFYDLERLWRNAREVKVPAEAETKLIGQK